MFFKNNNNRLVAVIELSKKAFGKYKKQILILTILGFVGGILEGIGVNALIPLFSFAIGDGQKGSDTISKMIEQFFGFVKIDFNVSYLLVFIIVLFLFRSVIRVYLDYLKIKITVDYEDETRRNIFHKILKADWPHLLRQKLGHLETIMLIDVPYSAIVLGNISTVLMLATSLIVYIFIAVNIDLTITLLTLALGSLMFLVIKPLNYRTKLLSREAVNQNKNIAHHVNENILGIKTVKSSWSGAGVEEKAGGLFAVVRAIKIKISVLRSIISSSVQPIALVFICLIFVFTYRSSGFSLAALVAITYLIQRIFTYVQQMLDTMNIIHEKLPYMRNAIAYQEQAVNNEEKSSGNRKFEFQKELQFENVSFAYSGTAPGQEVLEKISFVVKKGEMVGIIGPSGAGKTTLVDVILRLLKPRAGRITLDGVDISELDLESWRKNIGYISQDMFLMNDTIAANIRFYDRSVSDVRLAAAAKMANIYEFIQELPDKFETNIGERGMRLSAGQRQRIVIARVLSRDPKLLILDEATSALDNQSEAQIQKVIQGLRGHITVLAIAHRLTTVENSDRLIVLEKGRVSEQGKPRELLKDKKSYFSKTYNLSD